MKKKSYWALATLGALILMLSAPTAALASRQSLPVKAQRVRLMRPLKVRRSDQITFMIFLKPRKQEDYFKEARAVNEPGNTDFKHFMTPDQIRQEYGQPQSLTARWQKLLQDHHLTAESAPSGLSITASGKAADVNKLFNVKVDRARYHHEPLQFGKTAPSFPQDLARSVLAVVGLTEHNSAYLCNMGDESGRQHAAAEESNAASKNNMKSGFTSKFTDHYHVDDLYQQGLSGQGQTIGIISFGGVRKSDALTFWHHERAATAPSRLQSTKTPINRWYELKKLYSDHDRETTMDVEYAGSVAPQADIHVYNGEVSSLTNVLSTYTRAINYNRSSVLSCSWGLAEQGTLAYLLKHKLVAPNYGLVLNTVMAQAALQGITNLVISGDHAAFWPKISRIRGQYGTLNYTHKTSDPLATNPWMTCVGGTSLPADMDFPKLVKDRAKGIPTWAKNLGHLQLPETAWWQGNTLSNLKSLKKARAAALLKKYPALLTSFLTGTSGGFSSHYETPYYQAGIPGVNTFKARNYLKEYSKYNFNPPLLTGTGMGRNYPDLSANSSGSTGYTVYQYEKGHSPWQPNNGGVSIVAPQFAGVAALINSQVGRQRMGFWNPQLYQLAGQKNSPLSPLNSTVNNTNGYYTGQPGTIYNQATGLGIPNFGLLSKLYK